MVTANRSPIIAAPRLSKSRFLTVLTVVVLLSAACCVRAADAGKLPLASVKDPRDFEGTWTDLPSNSPFLLGVDLPYKPAAQDIAAEHLELFKRGHAAASAHLTCRPTGVQGVTSPKGPVLILQTPEKLVFIAEEDREVRKVFLNEQHPQDLKRSYSGDSVAHWEGYTLVIDTVGYNGKGQLDEVGNPHGQQLHMVQRLTKSADGNTLTNVITFDDPEFYTKPFTKTRTWQRTSGVKLDDYDCAENPRSDLFDVLTWQHDWFRPTCQFPVKDGKLAEKIVCSVPNSEQLRGSSPVAATAAIAPAQQAAPAPGPEEKQAVAIVNSWVAALVAKDAEKAASLMDEEIQYRDDPFQKELKRGHAQLLQDLKRLLRGLISMRIQDSYAVGSQKDDVLVLVRRVDELDLGGKHITIPMGAYYRVRNGKILEWLDTPLADLPPPPTR
jgi:limonene-1,2-epoxide hydrolase